MQKIGQTKWERIGRPMPYQGCKVLAEKVAMLDTVEKVHIWKTKYEPSKVDRYVVVAKFKNAKVMVAKLI